MKSLTALQQALRDAQACGVALRDANRESNAVEHIVIIKIIEQTACIEQNISLLLSSIIDDRESEARNG